MSPATRSRLRIAAVVAAVLLVLGLDAWAGFNLTVAVGCIAFFIVQFLAMTVGSVLALVGLVMWVATRFKSRRALQLITAALALALAAVLLNQFFAWIGLTCVD
jgi:hypothetical protein